MRIKLKAPNFPVPNRPLHFVFGAIRAAGRASSGYVPVPRAVPSIVRAAKQHRFINHHSHLRSQK